MNLYSCRRANLQTIRRGAGKAEFTTTALHSAEQFFPEASVTSSQQSALKSNTTVLASAAGPLTLALPVGSGVALFSVAVGAAVTGAGSAKRPRWRRYCRQRPSARRSPAPRYSALARWRRRGGIGGRAAGVIGVVVGQRHADAVRRRRGSGRCCCRCHYRLTEWTDCCRRLRRPDRKATPDHPAPPYDFATTGRRSDRRRQTRPAVKSLASRRVFTSLAQRKALHRFDFRRAYRSLLRHHRQQFLFRHMHQPGVRADIAA